MVIIPYIYSTQNSILTPTYCFGKKLVAQFSNNVAKNCYLLGYLLSSITEFLIRIYRPHILRHGPRK